MRARLLLTAFATCLVAAPAHALMLRVSLDEAARGADAIVHARVVSQASAFDPDTKLIHTDVQLEVVDAWKGTLAKGGRITVRVMGGVVGEIGFMQEHEPRFAAGEETVLLLEAAAGAPWRVHALEQGKFHVEDGYAYDLMGKRLAMPDFKTSVARVLRATTR